jgi:glycosyltransferase involved in cell wall biosynthesis
VSGARPLRVLVVSEGVLGHASVLRQLRRALDARVDVEARYASVSEPGRPGRILLRRSKRLGELDLFMLRWRLRWSWHARRLLRSGAQWADVAFVSTQACALLSPGIMRRLPCVLSVDATVRQFAALEYDRARDRFSGVGEGLVRALERRAVRHAAAAAAWTDWNARALVEEYGLAPERAVTIHPGIDVSWLSNGVERREPRAGAPLRVLFVGNGVRRKGLDLLVDAASRLDSAVSIDAVTNDEVAPSPHLHVHRGVPPHSDALRRLYAEADVFALPSRADAVPLAVVEGMAAGLPVIGSRVGAVEELVGDAGIVVPPRDVEALAGALSRLAADPALRERLGREAAERARRRYDAAVEIPRLVDLLHRAAGRREVRA